MKTIYRVLNDATGSTLAYQESLPSSTPESAYIRKLLCQGCGARCAPRPVFPDIEVVDQVRQVNARYSRLVEGQEAVTKVTIDELMIIEDPLLDAAFERQRSLAPIKFSELLDLLAHFVGRQLSQCILPGARIGPLTLEPKRRIKADEAVFGYDLATSFICGQRIAEEFLSGRLRGAIPVPTVLEGEERCYELVVTGLVPYEIVEGVDPLMSRCTECGVLWVSLQDRPFRLTIDPRDDLFYVVGSSFLFCSERAYSVLRKCKGIHFVLWGATQTGEARY